MLNGFEFIDIKSVSMPGVVYLEDEVLVVAVVEILESDIGGNEEAVVNPEDPEEEDVADDEDVGRE